MVGFLGGLGSFGSGFMQSYSQATTDAEKRALLQQQRQQELEKYKSEREGADAVLRQYQPGGALGQFPQQQAPMPQQPQPGQASQPMQPPPPAMAQRGFGAPQAPQQQMGGQSAGVVIDALQKASQATGVPFPILLAQAKQESSMNPNAPGGGLMQILDSTARDPGYGMQGQDPTQLRDPYKNAMFGAQYLKAKIEKLSGPMDWNNPQQVAKALQAYNGGGDPNYVQNVEKRMGGAMPGGAPQGQPRQPQGQPQAPQGGPGMPGGGISFQQLGMQIARSNPNITGPAFVHALMVNSQYLQPEQRAEMQMMKQQLDLGQKQMALQEKALEAKEKIRLGEEGLDVKKSALDEKAKEFQKKEERLTTQFETRRDDAKEKFEKVYEQNEKKILASKDQHEQARLMQELLSAATTRRTDVGNAIRAAATLGDADKVAELQKTEMQDAQDAESRIEQLRAKVRGGTTLQGGEKAAGKPLDPTVMQQMRDNIAKGAPREAVISRAKELGYSVEGF